MLSPNLEQFQADGVAPRAGHRRVLQHQPTQGIQKRVGHRLEPQAKLIGSNRRRRRTVSKEAQLLFLDPVFHFPADAVLLLVSRPGVEASADSEATTKRGSHPRPDAPPLHADY